jgi:hypothetical protein
MPAVSRPAVIRMTGWLPGADQTYRPGFAHMLAPRRHQPGQAASRAVAARRPPPGPPLRQRGRPPQPRPGAAAWTCGQRCGRHVGSIQRCLHRVTSAAMYVRTLQLGTSGTSLGSNLRGWCCARGSWPKAGRRRELFQDELARTPAADWKRWTGPVVRPFSTARLAPSPHVAGTCARTTG